MTVPGYEAARLSTELACEVTPHPLLPGRFEATWADGVMIGTAEDLLGSPRAAAVRKARERRAQMLTWLLFFRAVGRAH